MKFLYGMLMGLAIAPGVANADTQVSLTQDPYTGFDKAVVEVAGDNSARASAVTYYGPKVWVNGRLEAFWLNYINGTEFCRARGHSDQVSGGTILCGEDEDAFAEFNWYSKTWGMKSSGSANQCYPLYATIKCQ